MVSVIFILMLVKIFLFLAGAFVVFFIMGMAFFAAAVPVFTFPIIPASITTPRHFFINP